MFLFSGCSGEKLSLAELLTKGMESAADGRWKIARDYAGRAVRLAPSNPDALTLYALCLESAGDRKGAAEQIAKAAALNSGSYFIYYTKGRLLYDKGDYESCVAPLTQAHKLRPGAADPLILLAQASVKRNDSNMALNYYARLLNNPIYKKNPAPWSEIGMKYYLNDRNPAKALPYFNYAYAIGKKRPASVLNLAVFQDAGMKNKGLARRYYQEYLLLTANDSSAAQTRSAVQERLKKLR